MTDRFRTLVVELVVIVLGILIAFQVEEWRDRRAEQRDLDAVLVRLLEETEDNLERCEFHRPLLRKNALAVQQVSSSLQAGELRDGDRERFAWGLIVVGVVPNIPMHSSVAGEMLSTGLLKELENRELRASIARLPSMERTSSSLLSYWRAYIIDLNRELVTKVDFRYQGSLDFEVEDSWVNPTELKMAVDFDFDELAASRPLRNLFFEAVDVHGDLWFEFQERCRAVEETHRLLNQFGTT